VIYTIMIVDPDLGVRTACSAALPSVDTDMTAQADVGHPRQAARRAGLREARSRFWDIGAVLRLPVSHRAYLIMTDIIRLALFGAVARSDPRLRRYRFARPMRRSSASAPIAPGLLALHGIVTEPVVAPCGCRPRLPRRSGFSHQFFW